MLYIFNFYYTFTKNTHKSFAINACFRVVTTLKLFFFFWIYVKIIKKQMRKILKQKNNKKLLKLTKRNNI